MMAKARISSVGKPGIPIPREGSEKAKRIKFMEKIRKTAADLNKATEDK